MQSFSQHSGDHLGHSWGSWGRPMFYQGPERGMTAPLNNDWASIGLNRHFYIQRRKTHELQRFSHIPISVSSYQLWDTLLTPHLYQLHLESVFWTLCSLENFLTPNILCPQNLRTLKHLEEVLQKDLLKTEARAAQPWGSSSHGLIWTPTAAFNEYFSPMGISFSLYFFLNIERKRQLHHSFYSWEEAWGGQRFHCGDR